jgi:hypothetical protein
MENCPSLVRVSKNSHLEEEENRRLKKELKRYSNRA